ncbi:MAG: translation initiation factor IF-2 [Bacteroidales bacterium]|nr:translation initiation factor IF-2 [Bacteroidales bacterium]
MSEGKSQRITKIAQEFNISVDTIVNFLSKKGITIEKNPNAKISPDQYEILAKEFLSEKKNKEASQSLSIDIATKKTISIDDNKTAKQQLPDEEEDVVLDKKIKSSAKSHSPKPKEITESAIKTESKTSDIIESKPEPKEPVKHPAKTSKHKEETPINENIPTVEQIEKIVVQEPKEDNLKIKITVVDKIDLEETQKPQKEEKTKPNKSKKTKIIKEPIIETISQTEEIPVLEIPESKPEPEPIITPEITEQNPVINEPGQVEELKATETEAVTPEVINQAETIITEDKPVQHIEETLMTKESTETDQKAPEHIPTEYRKLVGPVFTGQKINLEELKPKKPTAQQLQEQQRNKDLKKKRKRIEKNKIKITNPQEPKKDFNKPKFQPKPKFKKPEKPQFTEIDIAKQVKETIQSLTNKTKSKAVKHRKIKRDSFEKQRDAELNRLEEEKKILKVTEFVSANELASLMNVHINDIIKACFSLGLSISINQRLDAETLVIVAEEFGYSIEFISADMQEAIIDNEEDNKDDYIDRPPIVTVMGHVDHGKTKLLDYIRHTNVVAKEAGGITQHIGAYEAVKNGKKITFIDTPGHEAFTAMRARGAKVTDVAIIVIAADEDIMPQTIEAINHAQAANVPMVFAINKIDKPNANIDKIKDGLSKLNYLVEDWGGKYQCQEISAKEGTNVDLLLDKVLLEAEMLELKANPNKRASGTVIESSLDKGKGYVSKLLVLNGTLKKGDIIVAGCYFGKVKAMYNEFNQTIKEAPPSTPLLMLGINNAPQAGDTFNVLNNEHEAKEIATKRFQLQREQAQRTQKHITLDEIGRRIAIGDFKELNLIIKGDVIGSVEALTDSLLKLSTPQVQVNVVHKAVGQITESDILLATASNAIVIGFQVRPSVNAKKIALQEQIDVRLYSIIYDAVNEIKAAIKGMLTPETKEKITSNIEVREVFKITKVGTVAGCIVLDGKIIKANRVRLIRDGIVVHTGEILALKHFKDDVKEARVGMECGISLKNFNDIQIGDIIEGFEVIEVERE